MKKIIILLGLMLVCLCISAQSYKYLSTQKTGSAYYQYDTIVSPVGTDTIFSFEGYLEKPSMLFIDFRTLDANDSELDVGVHGLGMDTVFLSLDTTNLSVVIDTTIFIDKVIGVKIPDCYAPEVIVKYTKGSATAGLKFPAQLFTPR